MSNTKISFRDMKTYRPLLTEIPWNAERKIVFAPEVLVSSTHETPAKLNSEITHLNWECNRWWNLVVKLQNSTKRKNVKWKMPLMNPVSWNESSAEFASINQLEDHCVIREMHNHKTLCIVIWALNSKVWVTQHPDKTISWAIRY